MARCVGIAGERANALHGAGLVQAAVVAAEQVGMGREELEHFGEAAGGKAIVAADARALLQMDGLSETMRGEDPVGDRERLLEADWAAQPMRADLQEDLVGDVIV